MYWEESWKNIDPDRICQYAAAMEYHQDHIICWLKEHHIATVCNAGCGCGIYTKKLAKAGFAVNGFDIADSAVNIAEACINDAGLHADLKTASVVDTGYCDHQFDAVISRDVLDHMCMKDGIHAIHELLRIVRPGGWLIITLDGLDAEYESEPHIINEDGDYVFTAGKWKGMVFHPYSEKSLRRIIPGSVKSKIQTDDNGITVFLQK